MKTARLVLLLFTIAFAISANAQNYIGLGEKEIRKVMKDKHKDMLFQTFTNNSTFKYLKYADRDEMQTLLFFLTPDSVCKSVRLICDKSLKGLKVKELDGKFPRNGDNAWIEQKNGRQYLIELKEEEWSFNITITQKE
ncbi:MAG: hypothetical protein U0X39_02075 [Bacteroidales bacterium]